MDVRKAVIAKTVTEKWGLAIFTTDWQDKPCKPTVYLLDKTDKGEWQMCGGWYLETLMDDYQPHVGIYIDAGANWKCPAEDYDKVMRVAMGWHYLQESKDVDPDLVF